MAMMAIQKDIPIADLVTHMIFEKDRIGWFVWFSAQRHIGIFGRVFPFFGVTFFAGGNQVDPRIRTTSRTRHDVIDRQIFLGAAILTFMVIALEYILPGKINALVRGVNISIEADDRWHWVGMTHGMQLMPVGGPHHFTFIQKHQDESALNRTDHKWTVILIKH
jgi:hypothetical protein